MKTLVDERLRAEAARYDLRFACPNCAYFDELAQRCAEGYPIDEHRETELSRREILFCKLFEAG